MTKHEAIELDLGGHGFFRHWMPRSQRAALQQALKGEERDYFVKMLTDLRQHIETMPKTYETDGQGNEAVAQLHYFGKDCDFHITEKDMGDGSGDDRQIQAFGWANLGYGAESGYISIAELIENNIELDLYWTPKKLKEL